MKIIKIVFTALIYISFTSCKKEIKISSGIEEFEVGVDKEVYQANEEVMFNLKGNPDMISFYSGEIYKQYDYRGEREIMLDKATVSFTSSYPDATSTSVLQNPEFKVLVSTDFNNIYNYENLKAANWTEIWTDITSRFTISTTSTAAGAAGNYQISDLAVPGKPLYVAFKYASKNQEAFGKVRRRTITAFTLTGTSVFGNHVLGNMVSTDFRLIEKNDNARTSSALTSTTITFNGFPRSFTDDPDPETDTWFVSKAFDLGKLDNGPDRPEAIKGNQDPRLTSHIHAFSKPGEYTVTFIGINANVSGKKEVVRQLKIKVE